MDFGRITDPNAWRSAMANLLRRGEEVGEYIESAPQKAGKAILDARARQNALMGKAFADPTSPLRVTDKQAMTEAGMNMLTGPLGVAPAGITKVVGPQAEALKIAQANAALPKEQGGLGLPPNNTPMDRAKAMGFDLDVYHGTANEIKNLDPKLYGKVTGAKTAKSAFWTSESPEVARTYAEYSAKEYPVKKLLNEAEVAGNKNNWDLYDKKVMQAEKLEKAIQSQYGHGQTIMPLKVRSSDLMPIEMSGKSFDDFGVSDEIMSAIGSVKKDNLNKGVLLKNLDDAIGRYNLPANHVAITNPSGVRSKFAAFDPKRANEPDLLAGALPLGAVSQTEEAKETRKQMLERLLNKQK